MKKTMLILAHPKFDESVVNKILIEKVMSNNDVYINNLSERYKDEKFDIEDEQRLLIQHERIIFQFPLYWYSYPAILKKWMDDVFTPGFAYGRKGELLGTHLVGKQFSIVSTIGGVEQMYTPGGIVGSSVNELLRHLQATIEYVGGVYTYPHFVYGSAFVKNEEHLNQGVESYLEYISSEYYPKDKQYEKLAKLAYEYQAKGYY
ncbi:NAD(P)H-dependent oxidoreductase [Serratia inhibens]|uniref:Flavodoxin family protein n=1 Tax=Serratia inhibens TaxID=2338073 RepID=A0AA92X6J5_9GAMM|nr:NAD(P)H-dependent oxidoreductase [Serratia inhibens]ANS41497.1 General stress protein 14 [Serratia inhibens PRI-2C]RJF54792.1 flavodoxin family protein [Serratia inhibens]